MIGSIEARFWAKVRKGAPDECWEWTAAIRDFGYGVMGTVGRKTDRAHRVSWILHHGSIPRGLIVCHRCDNPRCVNPAHLFLGTHADNQADKWRKGRGNPPPRHVGLKNPRARAIEWRGEVHTLTDWSRITGIHGHTIKSRLRGGWSVERALTEPPR